jgi:hypothetical protein
MNLKCHYLGKLVPEERHDSAFSRAMYDNERRLDKDNDADYFHTLLYLDEYVAKQSLENYNMVNVPLEIISGTRLQLQVGLDMSYLTIWAAFNKDFIVRNCSHSGA